MKDIHEIRSLIQQMTLAEEASLCSGLNFWYLKGIDRLGIPSILVTDGPHGLRKEVGPADQVALNESVPATCFPTASALAATWNRDLVTQVGQALGEECRQEKVGVILGPGANIKRSPLCGRNFEYFSEDPYLTGEMARSHILGVQSQGVGASLKHFAVNNQETRRMSVDTIVDERALREIYLAGFETAVKGAQPWTVMCAYPKVNGCYCSEHKTLMTDILKEEWGHQGLVVTDWGAMNERVAGLKAGVELEMPGTHSDSDAAIVAAVQAGQLDKAVLDRAVERILALIFKAQAGLAQDFRYDPQAHHTMARRAAAEGAVLLKNEGQVLPLAAGTKIALIGRFAKKPRYQGAGSSLMNPTRLDTLFEELARLVGADCLSYAPGYTAAGLSVDESLILEAVAAARQADVVVICAGLTDYYETEGVDRAHLQMPAGHNALIERVAAVHPKVIVVLSNGSPLEMPWIGAVPAVLEGYLGGQAGAGAIADILTGRVNPSGKLAETFPLRLEDVPASPFPGTPEVVAYYESLYVGYRYYDTARQAVLFPFGHGLSYTRFEYSDLRVSPVQDGSGVLASAAVKVKNVGDVAGKEVVQLYVRDVESSAFRPEKELKGFAKLTLQPGEEAEVTLTLDRRAFAFYDTGCRDWVVESGDFEILVGASSRDIRLAASLHLDSPQSTPFRPDPVKLAPYYRVSQERRFGPAEFEELLGRPIPPNQKPHRGQYTLSTPIGDMSDSWIARQLHRVLKREFKKMIQGQEDTPTGLMLEIMSNEMPMRSLLMSGGVFSQGVLAGLLVMINGRFWPGLVAVLRAALQKK